MKNCVEGMAYFCTPQRMTTMQSAFAAACSARRHGSVTTAAASPAMTFVTVNASVDAIAPVTRPSDAFSVTSIAKRMLAEPKM
jgi:hypothetical protein